MQNIYKKTIRVHRKTIPRYVSYIEFLYVFVVGLGEKRQEETTNNSDKPLQTTISPNSVHFRMPPLFDPDPPRIQGHFYL